MKILFNRKWRHIHVSLKNGDPAHFTATSFHALQRNFGKGVIVENVPAIM